MRITYDPEVDILMVHLVDRATFERRFARNLRLPDDGPILDLAADGTVLALEVMGASRHYGEAVRGLPLEGSEPLSLAAAAERAGVSVDALKFAAQRGRLRARKIGRNWTTTERDVLDYLESRQHGGPGSAGKPDRRVARGSSAD
jgi:hypothetical protein